MALAIQSLERRRINWLWGLALSPLAQGWAWVPLPSATRTETAGEAEAEVLEAEVEDTEAGTGVEDKPR